MTLGYNKMKKMISAPAKLTIPSVLAVGLMTVPHIAWANNATLTNLSTMQVSPSATELRFSFSSNPVMPRVYELKNPSSLVLEFDSKSSLPSSIQEVGAGVVDTTRTVSNDKVTRVTVLLNGEGKPAPVRVEGNDLVMTVNSAMQSSALAGNSNFVDTNPRATNNGGRPVESLKNKIRNIPAKLQASLPPPPSYDNPKPQKMTVRVNPLLRPNIHSSYMNGQNTYNGLSSLDFSGNAQGGKIAIALSNETIPIDVQRQGNKIVVRMIGSTVPRRLIRRMNIGSPLVSSIDANNKGKNGTVTINMDSDFEYQAYQSGRQLNISITPPKQLQEPTIEEKVYSGEPLSVEFQDVAIRNVLHVLGEFTKMNIVASDDVAGNITLRLINVPWDQALDIILKSKNLDKRVNGNVILVEPAEKLAKAETEALEVIEKKKKLAPLRTEYIRLSYAKVADVEKLIESSNTRSDKNRYTGSLLSERGTVTIDKRTNTLIIQDTSESIEDIRALVAKIDIPVKQVMIEARIVSATDNFSKEMGVKWGILSNGIATNDTMLVGGSDKTIGELKNYTIEPGKLGNNSRVIYDITSPDNLNVNLGVGNPAGRIAFSLLNMSEMMLDLELSAMQADNKGEVISTPKVLTADKQKAKISSGTQIPFLSYSSKGTQTQFIEAALSLEVTPNITPDGKIGLNLDISNGSPIVFNGHTAIAEDSIQTNILVEDGQTVVLGGVFKNTVANGITKVPFFGDLPYVGRLFRKNKTGNKKNELLIFITTKVVNNGVGNL